MGSPRGKDDNGFKKINNFFLGIEMSLAFFCMEFHLLNLK